jgi:hypothetical protein
MALGMVRRGIGLAAALLGRRVRVPRGRGVVAAVLGVGIDRGVGIGIGIGRRLRVLGRTLGRLFIARHAAVGKDPSRNVVASSAVRGFGTREERHDRQQEEQ